MIIKLLKTYPQTKMTRKVLHPAFRRWFTRIFGGFVLLVLLVLFSGYFWLRQSLPLLDGNIKTTGISKPVTVTRDADGVPTMQAVTRVDASYALGYLHAQERFFQMDLLRRSGAGELSELLGDGRLDHDRAHRRHRFRHRSELALLNFSENELANVKAYTSGVNDGLNALGSAPFEYTLLGIEPEIWTNVDSLLVVYAMYFNLQDSYNRHEQNYGLIFDLMGKGFVEFMVPLGTSWDAPLDDGVLPLAPIPKSLPTSADEQEVAVTISRPFDETIPGSNSWVVGGEFTETGAAIVADDMHLGLGVPNTWYRVRLLIEEADIEITGVSLPGMPVIIVGSNTHVAWGFTNSMTDTQDIVYLDWIDEDASIYRIPDGSASIENVSERICSSSGNCSDYLIRETIWGPLLENTNHAGRAMVTRWIAHDDGAVNIQLMRMETARTIEDVFRVAHSAGTPAQNLVVGDKNGNIGYTLLGPVPARFGHSGLLPVSWADGNSGWRGRLARPNIPEIINPPQGRLWSANARMVSGDMLANVGFGNYALAGRQYQIRDRLVALERATEDDMLRIQLDDEALFLARWRTLLLDQFTSNTHPAVVAIVNKVENWEGRAVPESIGYRVVRRFRNHVVTRVVSGLTKPLEQYLGQQFPWIHRTIEGPIWRLISARPTHLLPPAYINWNSLLDAAMDDVLKEIADSGGLEVYTWGAYTELVIEHPLSAFVPGLGILTDMPREQTSGDFSDMPLICAGGVGASQRMAVSPGHEENGIFQMPGGQSGHPLSPYFSKGHENWVHGAKSPFLPGAPKWTLIFQPTDASP